jgi:hypothetical protein
MKKKPVTAGAKEGLGAGVIVLGIMLALMPSMSEKIANMGISNGVTGSSYVILTGSTLVLAALVILAGIAVIFVRPESDDKEDE